MNQAIPRMAHQQFDQHRRDSRCVHSTAERRPTIIEPALRDVRISQGSLPHLRNLQQVLRWVARIEEYKPELVGPVSAFQRSNSALSRAVIRTVLTPARVFDDTTVIISRSKSTSLGSGVSKTLTNRASRLDSRRHWRSVSCLSQ